MSDETQAPGDEGPEISEEERRAALPPAAQRALAEAEERRAKAEAEAEKRPVELGGRIKGLEPVRYGDWEKGGLAIDF
ncbi:DUF1674 domain-containing protein [Tropicimonas sp. IMCC6043]|uniref:DUF1674 domain-containing protein n=1 Tax=Tropicimonas sp. IMCC6043 TaxID=2510645 RepID=UPI00101D698E|nr:DUF1674 domain-containing protein [Tropicimonas sp. IMCC6043]RYH09662.1 DUF1674 domain-containing protein [Tropicimonas sp. IMCC6043]